jgi:hypothetical protein
MKNSSKKHDPVQLKKYKHLVQHLFELKVEEDLDATVLMEKWVNIFSILLERKYLYKPLC